MKAKKMTLELKKLTSAIKVWQLACAGLIASQIAAPAAYAAPKGGTVVGGEGTIDTKDLATIIDQKTDLLAIDWDSFNLSEEELVKFLQPDSSSIVLNRILDQSPSEIRGAIEANGHVILANPRGVLFTETATVNVRAITASGLEMDPAEFMNGNFAFKGEDGSAGVVVNRGVINASSAVLVGKQVTNASSGLISAEMVSLAAADEAVLTFDADGMIGVKITKEVMENQLGVDSAVLNEGVIDGTQVLMEARVSGDLFTSAVNNEGTVRARGIDTSGGVIRLTGSGGAVANSGTLDASGSTGGKVAIEGESATHSGQIVTRGDNGRGGRVEILGDKVTVSGDIDARGRAGGGEVLIGGDYQGKNSQVRNAETTVVTAEADIDASGIGNSDGGKVIVWAEDSTDFAGSIRAESGALGGDGGFVETSGKVNLRLGEDTMFVSTLSLAGGETGEWLLDPGWLDISDSCATNCISVTSLQTALDSNNVTIAVTDANTANGGGLPITDDGDPGTDYADGIRVSSNLSWSAATTLTLDSFSDIRIENGVTISAASGDLSMIAGGSFTSDGTVDVNDFSLSVGGSGADTTNTLGTVTVAGSGSITGGAGLDSFTLTSADDVLVVDGSESFTLASNISFTAVDTLDSGTGNDTVTGADGVDWTLTGATQVENSGITFVNVDNLNATNAGLVGTAGDDAFVLTSASDVVVGSMTFGGLDSVDGAGGTNSLDASAYAAGVALTGNSNQLSAGAITFSNIQSAVASALAGSGGADQFNITAANSLDAAGISFSGLSSVDAQLGSDSVTGADGAGWTLTGTDNQAVSSGITFSNVAALVAVNAGLTGTGGNESFVLQADGDVAVDNMVFSGLNSVDGLAGTDSLDASAYGAGVALTGVDNQLSAGSITFSNINSAVAAALAGSSGADQFNITAANSLDAAGISFSGLSSVDAQLGSDSVTGADGAGWTLMGTDNQAVSSGITFSNVEVLAAVNASLTGTSGNESFVLQADGDVAVDSMVFSGLSSVDGLAGTDSLDASAYGAGVALTGVDNELNAGSTTFSNISSAVTAVLAGSSGVDTFSISGTNSLSAAEISFTGVNSVNAGGGSDQVNAIDVVSLTGNQNEAISSGITFSGLDEVNGGSLQASELDDTFVVTGNQALKANEIAFAGISTIDALGGNDSVTGAANTDWSLTDTDNQAVNSGITFSNIESVTAISEGWLGVAPLYGTSADESFLLESTDSADVVSVNGISFAGLTNVYGMGGSNTLNAGSYANGLTLTDTAEQVESGSITFDSIQHAVASVLAGSFSAEQFAIDTGNDNALSVSGISFTGLSEVNLGWNDTISAVESVTLTGNYRELDTHGIKFTGIETTVTAGNVGGTDGDDYFDITGANTLTVNGIVFGGVDSINAGLGNDTVEGNSGADWKLVSSSQIEYRGITAADAEWFDASNSSLLGTAGGDDFGLNSDGRVYVGNMVFSDVISVDAAGGDDYLDALAYPNELDLRSNGSGPIDNQVTAGSIVFSNIENVDVESLDGTNVGEIFTTTGNNSLVVNNINFGGLLNVDAKGGSGQDKLYFFGDWSESGNDLTANGILFKGIEVSVEDDGTLNINGDIGVVTIVGDGSVVWDGGAESGLVAIYGATNLDMVIGLDGTTWTVLSENQVQASGMTIEEVETLSALNSTLLGTSGNDEFTLTGTSVGLGMMTFEGLDTVDGLDGLDSVNAGSQTLSLGSIDNQLLAEGLTFNNIESAIASALNGTASAEVFTVTSSNSLNAAGISFSGLTTLDSLGGGDTLIVIADATLSGSGDGFESSGISFSGMATVDSASAIGLIGSGSDDSFSVVSNNVIDAVGVRFSNVDTVDGGAGDSDSVQAVGTVTLTGESGAAISSLINFKNIDSVAGGSLVASDEADTFVVTGSDSITANDIAFSGITGTIDAKLGDDSVIGFDGADWALTGTEYEAVNNGITFSNVEMLTAVNGGLMGTAGDDSFVLQAGGAVGIHGMTFSGLDSVDGLAGSNSLDASAYIAGVALTGANSQLSAGSITFSNIQSAVASVLAGSSGADLFTITAANSIHAAGISFSGLSSVNADAGSDTLAALGVVALTGGAKEARTSGIDFTGIEAVTGGSLEASDNTDTFVITGANAVTANEIAFSGISSVDAKLGNDSVTGADGADWSLTATNNEATNNGITFSNVEALTAVNGGLIGTAGDDSFVLQAGGEVGIHGMTFSGLDSVDGRAGSNSLDASAYGAGVALTGTNNQLSAGSITFSNIQSAVAAALAGSSGADLFTITAANSLDAAGISFSGLSSVNAGTGSDTVVVAALSVVQLTGGNGEAGTSGIDFTGIEAVTGGSLVASDNADTFVITGTNAVRANEIAFSGISSVDARGGIDSVTGADSADWTLTGVDYEAINNDITFFNVEALSAVNGGLIGTAGDDSFVLQAGGDLDIYNMTFSGLNAVDGLAGSNSLDASAYTAGVALTGSNNQLSAGSIIFSNIQSAVSSALAGSSGADLFTITAANSLDTAGISFSGLDSVSAGTDSDTVAALGVVTLTGGNKEAQTGGIDFTGIDAVTGGSLEGSDAADIFVVTGANALIANEIAFSAINIVDARSDSDTVVGFAGADWTALGNTTARNSGITFSNVELLSASSAGLIGTNGSDSFTLLADGSVGLLGMTFLDLNAVDALDGTDSLDARAFDAGLALTGTAKQLAAGGLLFNNFEDVVTAALAGTSGADTFNITGTGALSAAGMEFSGVTRIAAGAGSDIVSSSVSDAWALTANSDETEHAGITFNAAESFSGGSGVLSGHASGDNYTVVAASTVSVDNMTFSDLTDISGGTGTDSLQAIAGVTLSGADGAFSTSGISFSGFDLLTAMDLVATRGDDSFQMLADSSLGIYGLTISGVDSLDAAGGNDSVVGRSGLGYQLNSDASVTHDGIAFTGLEDFVGQNATLVATSGAEGFTMTAADALDIDSTSLSFSGLVAVDAGHGADVLTALGSVALNGTQAVTAGSIAFTNIDRVTGTGALTGTGGAEQFSVIASNQLDSYGIRFEGVNSVAAAGGSDNLVGLDTESWQLSGSDNALNHAGIDFTGLETTSGGNGVLTGSASADQFTITANNQVTANSITFTAITQVDAGAGADLVNSADGETWVLGVADGSAAAAGIDFSNIETVGGNDVLVDAATNNASDSFVLSDAEQALSVRGIDFSSVGRVSAGADIGDSVTSNASDWQLTGTDGELSVNGVELSGIDRVITANALLRGTANGETFALAGEGALGVAGMVFEGIARVAAGGGSDLLQGTAAADQFELADSGDISVAAISFSSIETVAAGEGADTVNSSGASWTSVRSGDALVEGSARAAVSSMTVLFQDLELVNNAGSYAGQDIDIEYTFSNLDTLAVVGVTFAGLDSFAGGSGFDVLRGADIDAQWTLNALQGMVSSGGQSLVFSGVESIVAGSGADQFTLSGGELTAIDTGAGNDKVLLAGTSLETLSLGEGNDLLQIDADSSQSLLLSGGSGDDEFQLNVADKTWQITGNGSQVGNFKFTGFEWLDNNTGSLSLETDQDFAFVNGGNSSATFNRNGAGILFADSGVRLGYDGSGDITINSTGTGTISGELQADRAELVVAGNVDIVTDVNTLDIHASGDDIDISILAKKDLVIDEINAGRGNIIIDSAGFGSLTAETYGDTHLTAGTVRLGSELQQWTSIGSAINPLRMDVTRSVDLVSISYFEPDFIGQIPAFTATGDELQSVAGAQAAQGLKSAVQNAVEDFAQVDPGIFSAVNPYSTGVDAVNTPEMRLAGEELVPMANSTTPDDEERLPGRAAELEEGEDSAEDERRRAGLAPTGTGG